MDELLSVFSTLEDPRVKRRREYPLESLIFITVCAIVSGADTWVEIEEFGKEKREWLIKYIYLPEGKAPCDDVYGNLFRRIDTESFSDCFIQWTSQISGITEGELINIDGKTLRGSYDHYDNKAAIHMVNAWSQTNQIVLGQYKTSEKSNEITAIPALLNLLNIKGAVISIDAMGCQKKIASQIINQEANYLLAVKGNQESLFEEIKTCFNEMPNKDTHYEITKDHGRIEERTYSVISDLRFLDEAIHWDGIKTIIRAESKTEHILKGKKSSHTRFYISSLETSAKAVSKLIRGHWSIENQLHWVLDVNFKEDESRVRKGDGDANFSIVRQVALNIIKLDDSKGSIRTKRKKAAWNDKFRLELLKI